MRFKDFLHLRFVVERCVVHDDEAVWSQLWDQYLLQPRRDGVVRTAALKQHGRDPLIAARRHDEVGALAIIAADFCVHFFAARRPSVRAIAVVQKATFIKVDNVFAAVLLHPLAQRAQIIYSATGMTLRVSRRFFLTMSIWRKATQIAFVRTPKCSARSRSNASG